ncbi:hypothetical protein KUCAC02_033572, partial [Chaenocephalus aceratus]
HKAFSVDALVYTCAHIRFPEPGFPLTTLGKLSANTSSKAAKRPRSRRVLKLDAPTVASFVPV